MMQRIARLLFAVLMVFMFGSLASAEEHKKGDHKKGESSTTTSAPTANPTPAPTARPTPAPTARTRNDGDRPKRDGDKPKREGGGILGVLGAIVAGADAINDAKREHNDRRDRGERRHVRDQRSYRDTIFDHERYRGFKRHAMFPVRYEDRIKLFGSVRVNGKRVGPHMRIRVRYRGDWVFAYWLWPYGPEPGVEYSLPMDQRDTTCIIDNRETDCYQYGDWILTTVPVDDDPDAETVYEDDQPN